MKTKFVLTPFVLLLAWIAGCPSMSNAALPAGYQGKPFHDSVYRGGAQVIPGRIECAYYDFGGEAIAYHDTDATNNGSGVLNQQTNHQRSHATPYHWNFRKDEGVDVSYTKDFADFTHGQNLVSPTTNQFYLGWTDNGEWCNYTVDVEAPGRYKIIALYGHATNSFKFSINQQPAADCQFPVATGSMHKWNKAEVGTITFPQAGLNLLTLHYNRGNNFAYLDFEKIRDDATAEVEKPAPAPDQDRVGFPKAYRETFHVLRTVNKEKEQKIVTVYGNGPAASVTNAAQLPYPYGSILVMETAATIPDAQVKPSLDEQGNVRREKVLGLHVMRREKNFGEAYGENRTGEWEYVEYRTDGSYITPPQKSAACAACHVKAGAKRDFVYRGRLPANLEVK